MGKDFYKILNVERNASQEEIKKAYRKLALKWHPDRCPPEQKEEAQKKFQDIGEAFEVLSDPEKKRIYDQVGEEGLRGGVPDNGGEEGGPGGAHFSFGGMPGGRAFHFSRSNAEDIFKQFFGTGDPFQAEGADPFASFMMGGGSPLGGMGGMGGGRGMHFSSMGGGAPFGGMGGMGGGAPFSGMSGMGGMGGMGGGAPERKADPIHQPLNVSLEDLYSGTVKKVRITKKILDASGRNMSVSSDKEINIKPGWKDGTKITFEREGDERPGIIPADIVFTLQTKPHDRFERDGDDLIYSCPVSLADALCGFRTSVQSLDGRQIPITASHVKPDTVKIIPGEGMPNSKKKTKGDLKVKFRVIFPDLTESERTQIANILQTASNRSSSRK